MEQGATQSSGGSERAEPAPCVKCEEKRRGAGRNRGKSAAGLNRALTMIAPNGGDGSFRRTSQWEQPCLPLAGSAAGESKAVAAPAFAPIAAARRRAVSAGGGPA